MAEMTTASADDFVVMVRRVNFVNEEAVTEIHRVVGWEPLDGKLVPVIQLPSPGSKMNVLAAFGPHVEATLVPASGEGMPLWMIQLAEHLGDSPRLSQNAPGPELCPRCGDPSRDDPQVHESGMCVL